MTEFTDLIPGLPEDIAFECLSRLHYSTHGVAARVCKRWRELLLSRDFYYLRRQAGRTHKAACLIQSLPAPGRPASDGLKSVGSPCYGITVYDPVSGTWDRVGPVPKYPNGLPLFCQVASTEGKLVVMGGWEPVTYEPIRDVFIYDFTTQMWKQVKTMPETRSFFAAAELNGRIIIAGGHDENKNALKSVWAYDVSRDEWMELPPMSQERDECEGAVMGSEFWVVSGYRTQSQGGFEGSAEYFDSRMGQWRRVEGAWEATRCPRSCVGVGKDGKLFYWPESDPTMRVGVCAIHLGECTFLSGSAFEGGPQWFCLVEGQNGKLRRSQVPVEFPGFVQSGCCMEI